MRLKPNSVINEITEEDRIKLNKHEKDLKEKVKKIFKSSILDTVKNSINTDSGIF